MGLCFVAKGLVRGTLARGQKRSSAPGPAQAPGRVTLIGGRSPASAALPFPFVAGTRPPRSRLGGKASILVGRRSRKPLRPPLRFAVMPVPPNLPVLAGEKALGKLTDDLAPAARHFAEKVSGSPAEQLGELFADKIRFRRWKNQIRLLNKATEYATEAGIDPESVSLTILTPLIEKAANEEDESMADRWAALLANASSERTAVVSPSFPDVLSRMSPLDALVFDAVALALGNYAGLEATVTGVNSGSIAAHHGWPIDDVRFSFEALLVLGLCGYASANMGGGDNRPQQGLLGSDRECVIVTEFGKRFLAACRPPIPAE